MSKKLQIVMPMAGAGSRFAKAGFETPKPLITVDGMAMFKKALSSVDGITAPKSYHFVIRQEHVDTQNLDELIKEHLPEANVIVIDEMTRGAAETALMAEPFLDPSDGLIVMDCDLWFNSRSYNEMVQDALEGRSAARGGLLTFPADNPRYSYARLDETGRVVETAEKRVISPNAITGAYFFATANEFTSKTKELMKQPISQTLPEYYISHVYNVILADGGEVRAATVDKFDSFGTPEELADYEAKA